MKRMLVLIKNLDTSEKLIEYVLNLARDLHMSVQLHYVENPSQYPLGVTDLNEDAVAQLQKSLEDIIVKAGKQLAYQVNTIMRKISGRVIAEVTTAIGNEITLLEEMVETNKIQMVMIEGHGSSSFTLKDEFANQIVRKINCPIWVIPENSEYRPPVEIIYANDYHEEDIATLKKIIDLTRLLSPKITALHITQNADFDLKIKNAGFQKMLEIKTGYSNIKVTAFIENNGDNMVQIINGFASRINASLIVVLKENKSFLERIFSTDSAEEIIEKACSPVLIYHTNK
ncbi:MAG: universal stress protein [Bacteroidota bacterium]|nr:universal stress protein [Bacteroidota bacterium]